MGAWRALLAVFSIAAAEILLTGVSGCRVRERPDTITISVPYAADTLDPHRYDRLSIYGVVQQFYEPLVSADAGMRIVPALAQRWESPDARTWVFHLRPGVIFHSGKLLVAADVVSTFDRILQSRDLEVAGYLNDVENVSARDARTVVIRTRGPAPLLVSKLRFVMILPKGRVPPEGTEDGTGPWVLSRLTNQRIEMRRFLAYWGAAPAFANATLRLTEDAGSAIKDFRSGQSELVEADSRRLEEALKGRSGELLRHMSLFVTELTFDMTASSPFRDKALRTAIDLAVDRQELVNRLDTYGVPSSQLVPPFVFGFNPSLSVVTADPAAARAALAKAVAPSGFSTEIWARRPLAEPARLVAEMLGRAGIRARPRVASDAEFFEALTAHRAPIFLESVGMVTGDSGEFFEKFIHTADPARGLGALNRGAFSSPGFDERIERLGAGSGTAGRQAELESLMSDLLEERVFLPLFVKQNAYAVRPPFFWRPRYDGFVFASEVQPRR